MRLEIIEKAWQVDLSKIDKGYLWSNEIEYGETKGVAKHSFLPEFDGARLAYSDEEITYLNIPVIRCKNADKVLFQGDIICRNDVQERIETQERDQRLDKLLLDNPDSFAYIMKRGSYYRPNSCGYTGTKSQAGIYTLKEAIDSVKGCSLYPIMDAVLIDKIEHNKMLQDEINDLKSRLI